MDRRGQVLVLVLIILLLSAGIALRLCKPKEIIHEPFGTIVLNTKSTQSKTKGPQDQLLFEPVDIPYYQTQPTWIPNYLDFDFDEGEVFVYNPDSQNVHDTIVQRSVRSKYKEIESTNTNGDAITAIKGMSFPAKSRRKIMAVLNTIGSRNTSVINLDNKTENQILNQVWSQVKGTNREKELFIQLEDCYEHGKTVCTTGVATRLISVLYLDDPENFPRTKGTLRQEMLSKAATLRNQHPDEDDNEFKKRLISTFEKDYAGILTSEEVQIEVSDWIDHV